MGVAVAAEDVVLEQLEMPVAHEHDVVLVRRKVKALADARGFGPFAVAAITTATSELTRNVWQHGGGGRALIAVVQRAPGKVGLRIVFVDDGPGIANVDRVLKGGYSTGKSLGIGLSGSRRLVDEFDLHTEAGKGTSITVIKWMRPT